MFPIENGPFYAFQGGMNVNLATLMGLVGDEECHVFNENDEVIPGLYVAGNAQGERFSVNYIPTMSGMSHLFGNVLRLRRGQKYGCRNLGTAHKALPIAPRHLPGRLSICARTAFTLRESRYYADLRLGAARH